MYQENRIPIGINGFGRIGRCILSLAIEKREEFDVKVINASRTPEEIAYLLRYDTVHGKLEGELEADDAYLYIGNSKIAITSERDPHWCDWGLHGAKYIVESTGKFLERKSVEQHLVSGAKKVVISAPPKDTTIPLFVYGVNHEDYRPSMDIVSNASCTTNCLAPLVKVLDERFGIEQALMTTVHAMTRKQSTVDGYDPKDLRIGRSAHNIIPTSTGAAKAIGKVIPHLAGKISGVSLRVPVENGSIIDLTVELSQETTYQEICEEVYRASREEMNGIIQYTREMIVSSDIIHDEHICIFDENAGIMLRPRFVKLFAWYDNEWGYANQLLSLVKWMYEVDNK